MQNANFNPQKSLPYFLAGKSEQLNRELLSNMNIGLL